MTRERLYIFDTTLRDGAQTQGVDFSVEDKRQIALALDRLGIDYIEGGWPGANPTDTAFFAERPALKHARFTAFGMTKRAGRSAANDPSLAPVLDAPVDAVCLVGKTSAYQVKVALEISPEALDAMSILASIDWLDDKTPTQWNTYRQVGTDYFEDATVHGIYQVTLHGVTAGSDLAIVNG